MSIRPIVCDNGAIRPLKDGERIDPKSLGLFRAIKAKDDGVRIIPNPDGSVTIDRVCCKKAASVVPQPQPQPIPDKVDVAIEKRLTTQLHGVSGLFIVHTTVTNLSNVSVDNVRVSESQSGMTYASATPSVGTYNDVDGDSGEWVIGAMTAGQVVTMEASYYSNQTGSVVNTGLVSTTTAGDDPTNNHAEVSANYDTTPQPAPCEDSAMFEAACTYMPDDQSAVSQYTITYDVFTTGGDVHSCYNGGPENKLLANIELFGAGGSRMGNFTTSVSAGAHPQGPKGARFEFSIDLYADIANSSMTAQEFFTMVEQGNVLVQANVADMVGTILIESTDSSGRVLLNRQPHACN